MVKFVFYSLIGLFCLGCISLGIDNKFGIYEPKKPNFKLKDSIFDLNENLDTIGVYKNVLMVFDGKVEFSYPENIWSEHTGPEKRICYYKFYSNGRFSSFVVNTIDKNGKNRDLSDFDLDPERHHKGYFITKKNELFIEKFIFGEGRGRYIKEVLRISNSGDTLIQTNRGYQALYVKVKNFGINKKYNVNW